MVPGIKSDRDYSWPTLSAPCYDAHPVDLAIAVTGPHGPLISADLARQPSRFFVCYAPRFFGVTRELSIIYQRLGWLLTPDHQISSRVFCTQTSKLNPNRGPIIVSALYTSTTMASFIDHERSASPCYLQADRRLMNPCQRSLSVVKAQASLLHTPRYNQSCGSV